MRVLIVASYNKCKFIPFVSEQAESVRREGCEVEYFGVTGKGIKGYLKSLPKLKKKIFEFKPDVIHAHFGLCGLLANLQRTVPVVTTYHGCDINNIKIRPFSYPSLLLSKYNIFVSKKQKKKVSLSAGKNSRVLPCGVSMDFFVSIDKKEAREKLNLSQTDKLVLFSSNFKRPEKNAKLALEAIELLNGVKLLELDGYTREEVVLLMNAVDCGLLTSIREGSPQFTKELLSCGTPIVSTNVGDVEEQFENVDGVFISSFSPNDVAEKVNLAINRDDVKLPADWNLRYDNTSIAKELISIYKSVINRK